MITKIVEIDGETYCIRPNGDVSKRIEYYCKEADVKPVDGAKNADILYEIDSGKVYLFDEESQTWIEQ